MKLIAARDLSIGPQVLEAGEPITPEMVALLPDGRLEQLRKMRLLLEADAAKPGRVRSADALLRERVIEGFKPRPSKAKEAARG